VDIVHLVQRIRWRWQWVDVVNVVQWVLMLMRLFNIILDLYRI
jgi:hypothetical protein